MTVVSVVALLICFSVTCGANISPNDQAWGHIYTPGSSVKFEFFRATFGGAPGCGERTLKAQTPTGCFVEHEFNYNGSVAVVHRGECNFEQKARIALGMGASGLIVLNNDPGLFRMPPASAAVDHASIRSFLN